MWTHWQESPALCLSFSGSTVQYSTVQWQYCPIMAIEDWEWVTWATTDNAMAIDQDTGELRVVRYGEEVATDQEENSRCSEKETKWSTIITGT